MKYALHYVLALSLIAAPIVATDCTEAPVACTAEVICAAETVPQEQPDSALLKLYRKVAQKVGEHKTKIAVASVVVLVAAVSTYILWKAGASQQVGTPETLSTVAEEKPTQTPSIASTGVPTAVPKPIEKGAPKAETTPSENTITPDQAVTKPRETSTQVLNRFTALSNYWREKTVEVLNAPTPDSN